MQNSVKQGFGPPAKSFIFTCPMPYKAENQIEVFEKANRHRFSLISPILKSSIFNNSTTSLVPGRQYHVSLIPIIEHVSSEMCLAFLNRNNALRVGLFGLMSVWRGAGE